MRPLVSEKNHLANDKKKANKPQMIVEKAKMMIEVTGRVNDGAQAANGAATTSKTTASID